MSEVRIVRTPDGQILGTHSWTGGFVPLKLSDKYKCKTATEEDMHISSGDVTNEFSINVSASH